MPATPRLLALAAATPPHELPQDAVAAAAGRLFGERMAGYERLAGVFASAGIETRASARPMAWFEEPRGWHERGEAFLEGAGALYEEAARAALARAGLRADEVDLAVTVCSTGVATPSLEARAGPRLGLRADAARVPVTGLGCAGGVTGLALAARLAASGGVVLLVAVELCTLAFRLDRATKADIVSAALFGDGAAAAIVSGREGDGPGLGVITGAAEHLWPETLDIMGWEVDEAGLGVVLSRSLPAFVERRYGEALDGALGTMGLTRAEVSRVVCHPGGTKVLEAIEAVLALPPGTLDAERAVLRRHGNMSSPTALFVLEEALARGLSGTAVLAALGPGFTASFARLDVTPS